MLVTLCDVREGKDPCGERALITVKFTMDGRNYEFDACDVHSKSLTANAREASGAVAPAQNITRLPKAGPKGETIDSKVKDWAISQGGDIAAAINQRGRQPKALKEQFLDTPEGKVWQQAHG